MEFIDVIIWSYVIQTHGKGRQNILHTILASSDQGDLKKEI